MSDVPAGTKLPKGTYEVLRWLAYRRHSTISAIIASYVARCVINEDLTGYEPPPDPPVHEPPPEKEVNDA